MNTQGLILSVSEIPPMPSEQDDWPEPRWICRDPLPVSMTDPMLDAPRTVFTPHMAWQTSETFCRAATMSVKNILNYFRGQPSHVANPDAFKV